MQHNISMINLISL